MKLPFQNSPKFALGDRVSYVVFDKRHSNKRRWSTRVRLPPSRGSFPPNC